MFHASLYFIIYFYQIYILLHTSTLFFLHTRISIYLHTFISKMTSSPSPYSTSTYNPHRNSQSYSGIDPNAPPPPPPKPNSRDVSRQGTPAGSGNQSFPRPGDSSVQYEGRQEDSTREQSESQHIQDPGDQWLPNILIDKSYVLPHHVQMNISLQISLILPIMIRKCVCYYFSIVASLEA